MKEYTASTVH